MLQAQHSVLHLTLISFSELIHKMSEKDINNIKECRSSANITFDTQARKHACTNSISIQRLLNSAHLQQ